MGIVFPMAKAKQLGKRIKGYRMENLMTQEQMAAWLGIGLRTIIRIEQGSDPKDLTRAKIEKKLNSQAVAA